ncbi:MAG TPA: hypothetical protein VFS70_13680, partial [Actinomycetota bacterium]|nr:hypothetical protein [Actinomycetota bacterium]
QAGTLVAATIMPITFQPTLMPRSALDQAMVTGISTSLNYAFAALIQDSIEAAALRGAGRTDPAKVDRHTWRRASIGLDLAAIGAGLAAQSALRPRPGERLPRGGARTAAWWLSATGLSGAVIGVLQELTSRRGDTQDHSLPVAPFASVVLAGVNEYRRRRWEARFAEVAADEDAPTSAARSFAMSLGVTAALTGLAAGERLFAQAVGSVLERGLPGHERVYRPLGHVAALSVLGGVLYELLAGSTTGSSGGPSRSRRPSTRRPPPSSSAAARGAGWPGRRSAARAAAMWPSRCNRRRSRRSWANRRWPSPSGCSWGWRAPLPRPSGSPWPWPSWSAPGRSTGSC